MKKILTLVITLAGVIHLNAQTFEGTITWTTRSDIKMTAEQTQQMAQAKKQLEAQMNNPEFKKQMEKNPEMKAMLEKQLKTMEGAGDMGSMLPEKMTTKVKGSNTVTVMSENNIILYRGNENKSYSIDPTAKTYSELPSADGEEEVKFKVTKTSETATINGYKCFKYLISHEGSAEMTQWLWVTKDIKDINPSQFASGSKHTSNWFYKDIDGFPVKIEIKTPQGNISSELTEIKRTRLPDSDFQIPAGYHKK